MGESTEKNMRCTVELENMPDFEMAIKRIYAWFEGQIIDRAPVRFSAHNSFVVEKYADRKWSSLKEKWFDVEFQVDSFIESIKGIKFLGETFPVYWPNLGPNFYVSLYGSTLKFGEVTSWAAHCINNWDDIKNLKLDTKNEYFLKMDELTKYALERCSGKFLVGYTDLHPGLDCVAAWRDTNELLIDLHDYPDEVKQMIDISTQDFQMIYNHYDSMLKEKKQLSVTWMGIPSFGKIHIPSCDFSSMISPAHFMEFCLPVLQREVKPMTHNIFHLDGKDAAKHLDTILEVPEINAIQWVQGVNDDKPIMQWVPLIKKIQSSGKSVVVDLDKNELEEFMPVMKAEGLLLCIDSQDEEEQKSILKIVEEWK